MKFELNKEGIKYKLKVDDQDAFESEKLSDIVRKIEAHLKLRYIQEPIKLGFMDRVKGVVSNGN
jgi:hypothetical protein